MFNSDVITYIDGMVTMPHDEFSIRIVTCFSVGVIIGALVSFLIGAFEKDQLNEIQKDQIRTKVQNAYELGYEHGLKAGKEKERQ